MFFTLCQARPIKVTDMIKVAIMVRGWGATRPAAVTCCDDIEGSW